MSPDKVVNGFRALRDRPVTQNELAWIEMLRAICDDEVPGPTLLAVQALRMAIEHEHLTFDGMSRSFLESDPNLLTP